MENFLVRIGKILNSIITVQMISRKSGSIYAKAVVNSNIAGKSDEFPMVAVFRVTLAHFDVKAGRIPES